MFLIANRYRGETCLLLKVIDPELVPSLERNCERVELNSDFLAWNCTDVDIPLKFVVWCR